MEPIIKSLVATLSTACAVASMCYSPMLLWAIAMGADWRWELLHPQVDRIAPMVQGSVALGFMAMAACMCVDVGAAYPKFKPVALGGCLVAACLVALHWLLHAQFSLL
jgi:hypothetical protein